MASLLERDMVAMFSALMNNSRSARRRIGLIGLDRIRESRTIYLTVKQCLTERKSK